MTNWNRNQSYDFTILGVAVYTLIKQQPSPSQPPKIYRKLRRQTRRTLNQQQLERRSHWKLFKVCSTGAQRKSLLASTASIGKGSIDSTLLRSYTHTYWPLGSVSERTLSEAFQYPVLVQGDEKLLFLAPIKRNRPDISFASDYLPKLRAALFKKKDFK